jgi:AcrR family transcriptional regulator
MNDNQSLIEVDTLNSKQEEKYRRIIEASIEIIATKGLDKTSISDIVKRAGIAQGTFYLYFSSKNALIPAIAEHLLQQLFDKIRERTKESSSFWGTLQSVIDVTFEVTEAYKEVLILCYSGLAFYHSFEKWESIYLPYYEWFESELKKAIEKGEVIKDIPTETNIRMIVNVIEQAAEGLYFSNDKERIYSTEQIKKDVYVFIKRALT